MSDRRSLTLLAAASAVVCGIWPAGLWAQGPSATRLPARPMAPRMGVIDSQRPIQNQNLSTYTIVGAVRNSGVYQALESSVPVEQLIEAAGGLTANASQVMRVVRNNSLRFQIFVDPGHPDPANKLMPGDVVIVQAPPAAAPPEVVPVVCLGLLNRPVVLPLDPSIQTVSDLCTRLLQSSEVANSTRLISPAGDARAQRLVTGTVVLFPANLVDRLPLQQPGALPEVLELHQQRPASTQNLMEFTATPITTGNRPATPAPPGAALPGDQSGNPSEGPFRTAPPPPEFAPAVPSSPSAIPLLDMPTASRRDLSFPPTLDMPGQQMLPTTISQNLVKAPDEERDSGAPGAHIFPQPSVAGIRQTARLDLPQVSATSSPAIRRTNSVNSRDSLDFQAPSLTERGSERFPQVSPAIAESGEESAPLFAVARTNFLQSSGDQLAVNPPILLNVTDNYKPVLAATPPKLVSIVSMLVGSFFLVAACCGLVYIWSRWQQQLRRGSLESHNQVNTSTSHTSKPEKDQVLPPAVRPVPSATVKGVDKFASMASASSISVEKAHSSNVQSILPTEVHDIVHRSVPVIEERIIVPSKWPLHGEVIGHRRIVLNQVHESVPAPHFNIAAKANRDESDKRRKSPVDERELRRSLREIVNPLQKEAAELPLSPEPATAQNAPSPSDQMDTPHRAEQRQYIVDAPAMVSQNRGVPTPHVEQAPPISLAPPGSAPDYDVVQPELSYPAAMSPLERALRTLASEKRG